MQQTMTTDEIEKLLQKIVREGSKIDGFAKDLTHQTVREIFYIYHTFKYDSIEDAFDDLREMKEEAFIKIGESLDGIEDPYLEEAKAFAQGNLKI